MTWEPPKDKYDYADRLIALLTYIPYFFVFIAVHIPMWIVHGRRWQNAWHYKLFNWYVSVFGLHK